MDESDLPDATERLRTGLLLHGSTAHESFESANRLTWGSSKEESGEVWRQGIALQKNNYFISDIFESMIEHPELKKMILAEYSNMDDEDYEASIWAMWLVISSVQMFEQLLSVEVADEQEINLDEWVASYSRHMKGYLEEKEKFGY